MKTLSGTSAQHVAVLRETHQRTHLAMSGALSSPEKVKLKDIKKKTGVLYGPSVKGSHTPLIIDFEEREENLDVEEREKERERGSNLRRQLLASWARLGAATVGSIPALALSLLLQRPLIIQNEGCAFFFRRKTKEKFFLSWQSNNKLILTKLLVNLTAHIKLVPSGHRQSCLPIWSARILCYLTKKEKNATKSVWQLSRRFSQAVVRTVFGNY